MQTVLVLRTGCVSVRAQAQGQGELSPGGPQVWLGGEGGEEGGRPASLAVQAHTLRLRVKGDLPQDAELRVAGLGFGPRPSSPEMYFDCEDEQQTF